MRLVAELPDQCRVRQFDSRDEAIEFARKVWHRVQNSRCTHLFLMDNDGQEENLWPAMPYNKIPAGYYAVDGKRYVVEYGRYTWTGWTFVKTGSDYHDRSTLASIRPDGTVTKMHPVLKRIAADPVSRGREYASITGQCFVCGRKLEDPDSRRRGCGPVCAHRLGVS